MKINLANKLTINHFPRLAGTIRISTLILACLLAVGAPKIDAAGSHLDFTFSGDGKTVVDYSGQDGDNATAIVVQGDGKVVVAGYVTASDDFLLMRFNTDGSLDSTFSGDGKLVTDFGAVDGAYAVAIQTDGKILAAGYSGENWAIARYNSDGTLDTTFSNDGKFIFAIETFHGGPTSIGLMSNGRIVLAGTVRISNVLSWAFARLNADGSLDNTFDGDGRKGVAFGGIPAGLSDTIVQTDGKIVAAGSLGSSTSANYLIARLNLDGSFDTTFDNEGIVTTDFAGMADFASGIKRTFDGKYIVAGSSHSGGINTARTTLARYNADGSLDTSFGNSGKVVQDIVPNGYETFVDLLVALNGNITLLGYTDRFTAFMLIRLDGTGAIDPKFGTNGRVNTVFGPHVGEITLNSIPVGMTSIAGDKIVAAGNYSGDFAVARYNREGIATASDFTDDGRSDIAVFRPSDGNWYVFDRPTATYNITHWGQAGDVPTPGDYDGDGRVDAAVFRNGVWYILKSSDGAYIIVQFGLAEDKPVQADYDGDGKTDIAVYRPSEGIWHLLRSTLGYTAAHFGISEDRPVHGDYDGDGLTDLAVFRPSTGVWYINRSNLGVESFHFGLGSDRAVPFDSDNDGRTDVGVYRPSTGVWYRIPSQTGTSYAIGFGLANDIPAPVLDAPIATFRPSTGRWYLLGGGAVSEVQWGTNGDIPIPSAYWPQ